MTKSSEYYKGLVKGIKNHADVWERKIGRIRSSDSLTIKVDQAREKRKLVINKDLYKPKTNTDISWPSWEESFNAAYQEYLIAMANLTGDLASNIHQNILSFGGLDLDTEFRVKLSKNPIFGLDIFVGIPIVVALLFGFTIVSKKIKLDSANSVGLKLGGAHFRHMKLKHTELRHTDLSGVDLSGVNLSGVDLSGAKLVHTDLSGAKLAHANLSGVNFRSANLSGADLRSANLSGVDLSCANLSGAKLADADLSNAIL